MWCRSCGIETNEYKCPVCGKKTEEEIPVEIYWCDSCKTPIIKQISDSYKDKCPCCGRKTKYMAKDIRPVFPKNAFNGASYGKSPKYICRRVCLGNRKSLLH